jgi:isopentenyl diphosphate isomerase/L-lactate dehydrogenase-like FMN-dependent dehydrogenase
VTHDRYQKRIPPIARRATRARFIESAGKPMFDGLDLTNVRGYHPPSLNWDWVKRLKDLISMKLVLKGIVTREDAVLALEHGVDGIVVSNHGARRNGAPPDRSLPEVVEAIAGGICPRRRRIARHRRL